MTIVKLNFNMALTSKLSLSSQKNHILYVMRLRKHIYRANASYFVFLIHQG
jgi:hypothetical protein